MSMQQALTKGKRDCYADKQLRLVGGLRGTNVKETHLPTSSYLPQKLHIMPTAHEMNSAKIIILTRDLLVYVYCFLLLSSFFGANFRIKMCVSMCSQYCMDKIK